MTDTDRLRAILDTAVDAIVTIDRRGLITGVNPATERLFGYSPDELVGQNVKILMPSPYHEEHDTYLANYLRTGQRKIIGIGREVVARRKDGSIFPIDLAVSEISHLGMFTGIIRDISDRKELERRLLDSREQEQRRIAQDLHDGLGAHLTGISMLARSLQRSLEKAGAGQAESAAELSRQIKAAHEEVRRVSHGLAPVQIGDEGLALALAGLAEQADAAGDGVRCRFACEGTIDLPDIDTATQFYRIAQEAMSNSIRHAKATEIRVSVRADDDGLMLSIGDDGVGIQGITDGRQGLGLRTMKYRAGLIGATFHVASGPEAGTVVTCTLRRTTRSSANPPSPAPSASS